MLRVVVFDDLIATSGFKGEIPADVVVRVLDRAEDAVAVIHEEEPDLVLMDFEMNSSVTGEAAVLALRAVFPSGTMRILAISSSPALNERMLRAGADGVLGKGLVAGFLRREAEAARARLQSRQETPGRSRQATGRERKAGGGAR